MCAPIFAPVNRTTGTPALFDPAQSGRFALDAPPAPWIDLGWIAKFARKSGTRVEALRAGSPAAVATQVRNEIDATVSLEFESWGKLQAALASGSQQTNLLVTAPNAAPNGSGGAAAAPVPLVTTTGTSPTASTLNVGSAAVTFNPGDLVAVDLDYTGDHGLRWLRCKRGVCAVRRSSRQRHQLHPPRNAERRRRHRRRKRRACNSAQPLLAGSPADGMQVSRIAGFCDREGASFFPEWSALFVLDGEQGDRVIFHYPRLQPMQGSAETEEALAAPLMQVRLAAGIPRASRARRQRW